MVCNSCGGAMRQFQRTLRVPVVRCVECGHSAIGIVASNDKQPGCEAAVTRIASVDNTQAALLAQIASRELAGVLLQALGAQT